jgi:membrane protease subunit HflK
VSFTLFSKTEKWGQFMAWDWDKLKQQHQRSSGGMPPGVEEAVQKFKNLKLPGGWIILLIIVALYAGSSAFYTVAVDEVGVVFCFLYRSRR